MDLAKIFCSYSHRDEGMRQALAQHLALLVRQGLITVWTDRVIPAGGEIKHEIHVALEQADIILLLVSASFLASDYCYNVEMKRALARHAAGQAQVIPIILRDCDWHTAPFGKLSALPTDGRPIRSWPERDKAYRLVAEGLRRSVQAIGREPLLPPGLDPVLPPIATESSETPEAMSRAVRENLNHHALQRRKASTNKQYLAQLASMIDAFDDADRMIDDVRAAEAGATINYIFDENVFEFFIKPNEHYRFVTAFQGEAWAAHGRASREAVRIDKQSAVLTGEYLFSGTLPGQVDSKIYVTSNHYEEFLSRSSQVLIGSTPSKVNDDRRWDFLRRIAELRAAIVRARTADEEEPTTDEHLRADLAAVAAVLGDEDERSRYLLTRVALETIVSEPEVSPLLQLNRLLSEPLRRRIVVPNGLRAPERADLQIHEEAHDWLQRLDRAEAQRSPTTQGRTRLSLMNDAVSLALVVELARLAAPGERLVFVTGDRLIHDAYREWHEEHPGEPFVLRRVSQYAPKTQASSHATVLPETWSILGETIEPGLMAFNIWWRVEMERELLRHHRWRLTTTLRAKDDQALKQVLQFFPVSASESFERYRRELLAVGISWRRIERILLGMGTDLLSFRIAEILPNMAELGLTEPLLSNESMTKWVSGLVDELRDRLNLLWLPIAEDIVAQGRFEFVVWRDEEVWPDDAVAATFVFGDGDWHLAVPLELGSQHEVKAAKPFVVLVTDEIDAIMRDPIAVFALAATIEVRRGNGTNARKFADLCLGAIDLVDTGPTMLSNRAAIGALRKYIKDVQSHQD